MKLLLCLCVLYALKPIVINAIVAASDNNSSSDTIVFAPLLPEIQYEVHMHNASTPAYEEFTKLFPTSYAFHALRQANEFALETLFISVSIPLDSIGPNGEGYSKVILSLESFHENKIRLPSQVASTKGNEIQLNYDYLNDYIGNVGAEFSGILHHESTSIWLWNGNGMAPAGLLSGIADYVRIMAGLPSEKWVSVGSGSSWDEGYAVTAYFLQHCTGPKPTFVAELHAKMKRSYSDSFFEDLLGKSVDELWKDYKSAFPGKAPSPAAAPPVSVKN